MNNSSHKITLILVIIIIASNIAWGVGYFEEKSALSKAHSELSAITQNKKILAFQKLFIDKVLQANGEVDFNTRVLLQNSVNDTGDKAIIGVWNSFLESKTEADGQKRVKELLSLLSSKVYSE